MRYWRRLLTRQIRSEVVELTKVPEARLPTRPIHLVAAGPTTGPVALRHTRRTPLEEAEVLMALEEPPLTHPTRLGEVAHLTALVGQPPTRQTRSVAEVRSMDQVGRRRTRQIHLEVVGLTAVDC